MKNKHFLAAPLLCALAVPVVGGAGTAEAAGRGYDLTPWVIDLIKMQRGLPGELDWSSPEAPDRGELEKTLVGGRPTLSGPEQVVEGDTFLIHFTTEGEDAATLEQVQWAYDAIEKSWSHEIDTMGYPSPPTDGTKGGDSRYDFYFTKQRGTYGVCYGEDFVDTNSMTSYIALATWMGKGEIEVTVSHEFFHSIHYAIDALEEVWWYEVTATWMEDMVYDDINDYYNYLPSTLENPETPLTEQSSIMYGNAIWGHSLSEKYGEQVIQDIWLLAGEGSDPQATEANQQVLGELSAGGFDSDLQYWRESFVDLSRFSEGASYPAAGMTATVDTYPTDDLNGEVAGLGANLIEIPATGTSPTTLSLALSTGSTLIGSVLVKETVNGADRYTEIVPDSETGSGFVANISDFGGRWKGAYVVISNVSPDLANTWSLHVEAPGWTSGDDGGCSTSPRTGVSALSLAALLMIGLRRRR